MNNLTKLLTVLFVVIIGAVSFFVFSQKTPIKNPLNSLSPQKKETKEIPSHPMSIERLRAQEYVGSDLVIEETLADGPNYKQFIASYKSEGFKIFGLLTVPTEQKPEKGFPTIVFLHGYIPPKEYSTTDNYPLYQAVLARNGFVTFKPDLRGHGKSEGEAVSAHFSEKYVVDTLYAIATLKKYKDVDPQRIGLWGHSNGGEIGLRTMVISKDVKVGSFWAGVVGSFPDMLETYNAKIPFLRNTNNELTQKNGMPSTNPAFWNTIDPYAFLNDISGPVQLQHGTADDSVPYELSVRLKEELEKVNKPVEYYEYPGDDHNVANNFSIAWQRTVEFYKKYL